MIKMKTWLPLTLIAAVLGGCTEPDMALMEPQAQLYERAYGEEFYTYRCFDNTVIQVAYSEPAVVNLRGELYEVEYVGGSGDTAADPVIYSGEGLDMIFTPYDGQIIIAPAGTAPENRPIAGLMCKIEA